MQQVRLDNLTPPPFPVVSKSPSDRVRRQSVRETMQAHAFFNDIPGAEPGEDANARRETLNLLLHPSRNWELAGRDGSLLQTIPNTWSMHLGDTDYCSDFITFFVQEINDRGVQSVITNYLPKLMEGCSGLEGDGLSLLGWVLELHFKDCERVDKRPYFFDKTISRLVPQALATLAATFKSLGGNSSAPSDAHLTPMDTLTQIALDKEKFTGLTTSGKSLADKLKEASMWFGSSLSTYSDQATMTDICLDLYGESQGDNHFIHSAMQTKALANTLRYLPPDAVISSVRAVWKSVLAMYVVEILDKPKKDPYAIPFINMTESWYQLRRHACMSFSPADACRVYIAWDKSKETQNGPEFKYWARLGLTDINSINEFS